MELEEQMEVLQVEKVEMREGLQGKEQVSQQQIVELVKAV